LETSGDSLNHAVWGPLAPVLAPVPLSPNGNRTAVRDATGSDSAPGGGIRAEVGEQNVEVQLAFGRTSGDAEDLERAYEIFDVDVIRNGNIAIAWIFDPTEEEREL